MCVDQICFFFPLQTPPNSRVVFIVSKIFAISQYEIYSYTQAANCKMKDIFLQMITQHQDSVEQNSLNGSQRQRRLSLLYLQTSQKHFQKAVLLPLYDLNIRYNYLHVCKNMYVHVHNNVQCIHNVLVQASYSCTSCIVLHKRTPLKQGHLSNQDIEDD